MTPAASASPDPLPSAAVPLGATVLLNARTRSYLGGELLVGGVPSRAVRLKPAALHGQKSAGRIEARDGVTRALAQYLVAAGLADPDPYSLPVRDASEITVVIPCYQRSAQLRRLLGSIAAELPEAEVVVVDDHSGQTGPAVAGAAAAGGARLMVLPRNAGPAAARNAGLSVVRTPFVLFVDTDVVLRPGSIQLLLRHFADPELAAAAPRVLGLPQQHPNWVLRYESARSSLDHGPDASLVRPHSPMSWVSTTCLLARTDLLGGGFNPALRVAEDVDLVWRLSAQGHRVRYEPRAAVDHEHRATVRGWLGRKFDYGTGAASLAQRHGDWVAPAVMAPWAGAALLLAALQRRWSGAIALLITGAAVAGSAHKLSGPLPGVRLRWGVALRLTGQGAMSAAAQGMALAVRHWWPGCAAAAVFSRRVRRLVLAAGVAEGVWEYRRLKPDMDPLSFLIARRLDDIAYGIGVWAGAFRAGAFRTLLPTRPRSSSAPPSDRRPIERNTAYRRL